MHARRIPWDSSRCLSTAWAVLAACGTTPAAAEAEASSTGDASATAHDHTGDPSGAPTRDATSDSSTTAAPEGTRGDSGPGVDGTATADTSTGGTEGSAATGTTGEPCAKNVVLMGYWPPTNEMLRPWSEHPAQNPGGWQGQDWAGLGFDVRAFFPEFPPDGDPTNDPIGAEGSVGSPRSDLRVDYQDTSADFWSIVDTYQPVIVITTSRGGSIGWEIEAIDGGHGGAGADPALDWASDGYGPDLRPAQTSVDVRTWDAISTYRGGTVLPSQLPLDAIQLAAQGLGLTSVAIDASGTSGNYLSGFLGLHGLVYGTLHEHVAASGHIHVGTMVPTADAHALMAATLQTVLEAHPADTLACPLR